MHFTHQAELYHAVNGVSFDLKRGSTLGLVGETGAGKTSIAKAIIGVLPDPPARVPDGQIILDGENLLQLSEKAMRKIRGKKVSMIFQDPMTALNPVMKVGNQIAETIKLHNKNMSKADAEKKAVDMLQMVGITPERYSEYPHQFSGGMKQRVIIAMALACNPELLLADEPTTALDVTIQAQVLEMINNLKRNLNTSMIMITHDLGIVAETCDEVAVVYAGQIVEYGNLEAIFDHPTHPYTEGLFGAIPKLDEDVERLKPVEGMLPDPSDLPKGCNFSPRCKYAAKECMESEPQLTQIGKHHLCRCHLTAKEK
ncbi:MAG: ABC transporter ATP-binding protein [Ruminococcus sp.]